MNKKTKNALILILLVVFCLFIFASCNKDKPGIFEYSEKDLGVMGRLVKWMRSWVGSYGWTVVVFTVFLKVLMLPLDFWQRFAARKSSLKMQQMQPIIEGIDKRYGANTQRANEEKQKLYRKQGFSMLSSCLPMIVSMVIFIIMFRGLTNYSNYSSIQNFKNLSNTYYEAYASEIVDENSEYYNAQLAAVYTEKYEATKADALAAKDSKSVANLRGQIAGITEANKFASDAAKNDDTTYQEILANIKKSAIESVKKYYTEHKEGWLWIENVLQPDTWASIMQQYEGGQFDGGSFSNSVDLEKYPGDGLKTYEDIRNAVLETGGHGKNGSWNGLMILPFMSIGLSFLSMFISQRMEKKNRKGEAVQQNAQQAATSKMMMIMMPLMMAFFGFMYTGAFSIYMVINYTLSILTTIAMRLPVEKMATRSINKDDKKNKSGKATYMR